MWKPDRILSAMDRIHPQLQTSTSFDHPLQEQLPQHLENPADTLIIQGAPKAGPALLMTTGDTAGTSGAGTAVAARGCAASVRK